MEITKIDPNFLSRTFSRNDIKFYDSLQTHFKVFGLLYNHRQGCYHRLPFEIAADANSGVEELNYHTSGGRIRFSTDSEFVALSCVMRDRTLFSHMPQTGTSGFSLYIGKTYYDTFIPGIPVQEGVNKGYEGIITFPGRAKRDITVYFPLYNGVDELFIGLQDDASIAAAKPYRCQQPVAFYGSSITQGGCASRPGNSYDAITCRALDTDFINFGFSGSAKGELGLADYFASLHVSAFVYDYDYNAPTVEHLKETHYLFYRRFRSRNAAAPVVMISRPGCLKTEKPIDGIKESGLRRRIIRNSYEKGIASGDKNLYFIDGRILFGAEDQDACTVDGIHPNDLGFKRISEALIPVLGEILERKK
jgi:hypothetical protein